MFLSGHEEEISVDLEKLDCLAIVSWTNTAQLRQSSVEKVWHVSKSFYVIVNLFACNKPITERHVLQYIYSALSKPAGFSGPQFSAVGLYDDRRISHYRNEEQTWKRDHPNSEIWTDTEEPDESKDWFMHLVYTLSNCTRSKCDNLHTLQRRIGCEVDAGMNVKAFDEYRYDGEDFIAFNSDTRQWTEKHPKAIETKMNWDADKLHNLYLQSFLETCKDWISTYDSISNAPDVHMFASEAPHDRSKLNLSCLATGFYPKHIEMKITLNGRNLEAFSSTGVRPNDDESFQMRISVEIHRDEEESYECHVSHSSQTQTLIIKWDEKHTNSSEESRRHDLAVTAAVFALIVFNVFLWCFCTGTAHKELNGQMNFNGSSRRENVISGSPELRKPVEPNRFQWLLGPKNVCLCTSVKPEEDLPTFMRFFHENTSQGFKIRISFHRSDQTK
ncbi:zinc-alpha-2-glycoprotein-like [Pimephales promelas]|uniref:zinc-alpha-2-glycoprotein-like n=1 Tax=Pimephales promelas TaxID=90988 RepID=UPI001955ED83|nr:zinc-alpha-2-glycoprotein-like [Pimephales promelas]